MAQQDVEQASTPEQLRAFIKALLNDLRALEKMIASGMIESGVRRIGAEQELFLVNSGWRPASIGAEVLDRIADPHFTTEIAKFNLEINLDPVVFEGESLSRMERQLNEMLAKARAAANACEAEIVLTGILPTIRKSDLDLNNMTARPRYAALNKALTKLRGGAYEFKLKGADELSIKHDNWMLEACCTSFQIHFQAGSEEFANLYNVAQLVTAPVLAAAANSPLLFGRRLWTETRIPLFQQSVDTRRVSYNLRERSPRVSFGQQWVKKSPLELFEEDIARFRVLLGSPLDNEDSLAALNQGVIPELQALRIYNGTVWRWNRPCYGITDGRPHLRIEARAFPSGPTVIDEVANAAFFFGLMRGVSLEYPDVANVMEFEDAQANFLAAARLGLDAQFAWIGGKVIPARGLICRYLLPVARYGLETANILPADIDRFLGVIEERVSSGKSGSQWLLSSLSEMRKRGTKDEVLTSLTAATVRMQKEGRPVHQWPPAEITEVTMSKQSYLCVEEFMTTDLFTVHEDEPVELVANLMNWKRVRHIPVEDEQGRLVGLVSSFEVLSHLLRAVNEGDATPATVGSLMNRVPLTVTPETLTLEAIALMRREKIDCLPVVKEGRLVGIVSERDFINVAGRLLERMTESLGSGDKKTRRLQGYAKTAHV
ncbi:MAG: glutamate-cysteine ligase family protein [Acidobacteriota bacterium]